MATSKEKDEYIARLEAENAILRSGSSDGRIWPDVSKAVKEGRESQCTMVLRGVNANPKNTVNMYPAQFARLLKQLPDILEAMLEPKLFDRFKARTDEERKATRAYLEAYLSELKGGDA